MNVRCLVCVLVAIASVGSAAGQEPSNQIAGIVVDSSGAAVVGAAVTVHLDGVRVATTHTSGDGRFVVFDIPRRGVVLRVGSPGFAEATVHVAVAARQQAVEILLQPAGLVETVTVTASRGDERLATPASGLVVTSAVLATEAAIHQDSG